MLKARIALGGVILAVGLFLAISLLLEIKTSCQFNFNERKLLASLIMMPIGGSLFSLSIGKHLLMEKKKNND